MTNPCMQNLSEVHLDEAQSQLLIDAYDKGFEAEAKARCPHLLQTALSVVWHLGREHAQCEGFVLQ